MYCYDLTNQKQSRILCDREVENGEPFLFTPEEEVIFASYEAEKGGVSLKLFLQPLNGNGEKAVSLFPEEEICHGVDSFPVGRTAFGRETPAYQMSKDGEWVYFRAGWKGWRTDLPCGCKRRETGGGCFGRPDGSSFLLCSRKREDFVHQRRSVNTCRIVYRSGRIERTDSFNLQQ